MRNSRRDCAREMAEQHKKMGYLEVKDTRYLRLVSPLKDDLRISSSYGGLNYPTGTSVNAFSRIPLPSRDAPRCVLVGRNPSGEDGPPFLRSRQEIGELVHAAMTIYQHADRGKKDARLPKVLERLNGALDNVGLPHITTDMPPIDLMVFLPSPFISRLAGLLVFGVDPHGAYCAITNVSLNQVHVATKMSFVDFSSLGFVAIDASWQH